MPCRVQTQTDSISQAHGDLNRLNLQTRTTGGEALRLISRNKNVGFQRHRAADVNGIHTAYRMAFQARYRLRQYGGRQVAQCRILDVRQQRGFELPVLNIGDFVFTT